MYFNGNNDVDIKCLCHYNGNENHAGEVLERVIENMLAKDANGKAVETEIIQEYMQNQDIEERAKSDNFNIGQL